MRREERQIKDINEIYGILDECRVCRLAMLDKQQLYVVPLNFGYAKTIEGFTLYMHGALQGRKIEVLSQNPEVCFEMDVEYGLYQAEQACAHSYGYASVIGWGRVEFVQESQAKAKALNAMMRQLSGRDDFSFPPQALANTAVLALPARSFTAKRNRR